MRALSDPVQQLLKLKHDAARMDLVLAQRKLREIATSSFLNFVRYMRPDISLAWFHLNVIELLQQVADKKIHNLIISMPPGCGKSTLASELFPAYLLGRDPNHQIIGVSYNDDLSTKVNRNIQDHIASDKYRLIYPGTVLPEDNSRGGTTHKLRNNDLFQIVGARGQYVGAGILGGISGKRGDIIIDDPIKNMEQADSSTHRDKIDAEYRGTLLTRPYPDGFKILIQTRWHGDDLAGRRIQDMAIPGAEQWVVFTIPAVKVDPPSKMDPREPGEAIWPESGRDVAWAKMMEATSLDRVWSCLYQQSPTTAGANIIKSYNLGFWYPAHMANTPPVPFSMVNKSGATVAIPQKPLPVLRRKSQSWDMTFKDTKASDLVAGQVWGCMADDEKDHTGKPAARPVNAYLLDAFWDKADFEATRSAVLALTAAHPTSVKKLVEDKANGPAIISSLKMLVPGFEPVEPKGGKVSRANAVTPYIDGHNVWIPHPDIFPWVRKFIKEINEFPKGKHDDMVDSMTQALLYIFEPAPFKVH